MSHVQGLEFYHEEPPQGDDVHELAKYVARMLQRMAHISQEYNYLLLPPIYEAPPRVMDGLIVHADGTSWDPGSGQGIYAYYNASWNKLG